MTLTTILLFLLAFMGVILLIMMATSQGKKIFFSWRNISRNRHSGNGRRIRNPETAQSSHGQAENRAGKGKETAAVQEETAFVISKQDERLRILDEYHHSSIKHARYELVFERPDGSRLVLTCSKMAHSKMPYREAGVVTFREHKFIRFQSEKETISDEYMIS